MPYVVPVCGLLFVLLAAYTAVAEVRRALLASGGDLKVLRPFGSAWMAVFAISCAAAVFLKNTVAFLVMGGLVLIAWICIPAAVYLGWKIRSEGPMGIGKRGR